MQFPVELVTSRARGSRNSWPTTAAISHRDSVDVGGPVAVTFGGKGDSRRRPGSNSDNFDPIREGNPEAEADSAIVSVRAESGTV